MARGGRFIIEKDGAEPRAADPKTGEHADYPAAEIAAEKPGLTRTVPKVQSGGDAGDGPVKEEN